MNDAKPQLTIYTDGGSEPNPGPGGWGAILLFERDGTPHEKELSGAAPDTTNNRMELTAAIEALRALKEPSRVMLHTDSQYLRRGITAWLFSWKKQGWRRKDGSPVQNVDLWQTLDAETQRHEITWEWVKGHAGNEYNERVDRLATEARRTLTGPTDNPAFEPVTADHKARRYHIALRVSVPQAGKRGGYALRIVDLEGDTQETYTGSDNATTSNRLILLAAEDALSRIPAGASAAVFCPDNYLQQGMTQWVEGWQRNHWKTKGGTPVKNQPEWRALHNSATQRDIAWLPKKHEPEHLSAELDQLASDAARGET